MEEKGTVKISLAGFFLILAIIAIITMGFFMYKIYTDKQKSDEKVETLNSEVNRLQDTINSIQSTINNTNKVNENAVYNNATKVKTETVSRSFSDDEIKQSMQNYLDLICAQSGSMRGFLVKLGLINFSDEFDMSYGNNLAKTNVKYSEFKEKMLNYVTEEWFENSFTELYKNINGYLYFNDGGASGLSSKIQNITKKENGKYIAEVKILPYGEEEGAYLKTIEFNISNYNDKCVISYCDTMFG